MKEYLLSIVLASILGGICEELLHGSLKRYLRWVTGICVLAVIVLPVTDLARGLSEWVSSDVMDEIIGETEAREDYAEIMNAQLQDFGVRESERVLATAIAERFSIDSTMLKVTLSGENGQYRVVVCLSGSAIWQNPYLIEIYVNETFALPCDVIIA